MSNIKDKLSESIFNAIFDEDDLTELKNKRIIAQKLGYKLSVKAAISCELDCVDYLEKENSQLKEDKAELIDMLNFLACTSDMSDSVFTAVNDLIQKHKG